jgi:CheY-like chemotaxis protein
MERSSEFAILVAHERLVIGQAIRRVLAAQGFRVEVVQSGEDTSDALKSEPWDGLVLDVALPGPPAYELIALAKTGLDRPVRAVVLVASVFRRTSYKRKPQQLYGADDYVEIHHLGDELPSKLWRLLAADPSGVHGMLEAEAVLATLQAEGDQRLFDEAPQGGADPASSAVHAVRLAELIVADVILYSGDRLLAADTAEEARAALATDLDAARELYRSVAGDAQSGDPIGAAFDDMLRSLVSPHPGRTP